MEYRVSRARRTARSTAAHTGSHGHSYGTCFSRAINEERTPLPHLHEEPAATPSRGVSRETTCCDGPCSSIPCAKCAHIGLPSGRRTMKRMRQVVILARDLLRLPRARVPRGTSVVKSNPGHCGRFEVHSPPPCTQRTNACALSSPHSLRRTIFSLCTLRRGVRQDDCQRHILTC